MIRLRKENHPIFIVKSKNYFLYVLVRAKMLISILSLLRLMTPSDRTAASLFMRVVSVVASR